MSGLLIAAPSSGSGKTTVTLGLLRALKNAGLKIAPGKAGPDYIDPAFHTAASGEVCFNFDPWGMRPELLAVMAGGHGGGRHFVVEAMMGLFDGASDGSGSPADLAAQLDLSIVLVIDCARMSHSVAALASGYRDFRKDVRVAGVILNRVGSVRHEAMLRVSLERVGFTILGALPSDEALKLPERHLGLVQATEHEALEDFIEHAAARVEKHCDVPALLKLARRDAADALDVPALLPPLGQRIAVARDAAFAFSYPHLLQGWRGQGAELSFFSPLNGEAPNGRADAIYLPGGYPELHAGRIAAAEPFFAGMRDAVKRGALVYGECGGYMVLGEALVDAAGVVHAMLGLLPVTTTFAKRQRHLGLRVARPADDSIFQAPMRAHEFHYSTIAQAGKAEPLFRAEDALGADLGPMGMKRGRVAGSYLHLIDLAPDIDGDRS
ncbi:cobyrinate a,c-diamide synthase [Rhizobium sp. C1]|uniref:cobyrinate a,c-diamide synthase n=1 Tax=Rhizobium sp. C1 TaxID=1349799 RepID=UPI001E2D8072|nr:cobyrinate a,c-diamide synthase [Rhizobium sp. C1]MCD2176741.1 cobyrinate a,c-diamide synthase [Rhizobium sp. C1]